MAKLYRIKLNTYNNEGCWITDGFYGSPPSSKNINHATVFPNEAHANWKMELLKKRYPNQEFSLDCFEV